MEHEAHAPKPALPASPAVASWEPEPRATEAAADDARQDLADVYTAPEARYEDGVPDIETVDVPEPAVAMADDLDLPSLAYEEDEPKQAAAYDDIEADFAATFQQALPGEEPVSPTARAGERTHSEVDFGPLYRPI